MDDAAVRAVDLARSAWVLTMATAGTDGPWSAPVYYVYHRGAFWFFSSPEARHVRDALASGGRAAASIHQPTDSPEQWQELRGLQMAGALRKAGLAEAVPAFAAYCARFPFVQTMAGTTACDLDSLAQRFRVRLYAFTPEEAWYTDNSIRFGQRERVTLAP